MSQMEALDILIPAHFPLEQAFSGSQSWVITLRARLKCWSLHTPVVSDPETGSLSSKPFMAITLTWYSTPGVSFTRRVSVSVPSTVTMEGAPGDQQSKIRHGETHSHLFGMASKISVSSLEMKWYLHAISFSWLPLLFSHPLAWRKRSYFLYNAFFHWCRCQKLSQERKKIHEVTAY